MAIGGGPAGVSDCDWMRPVSARAQTGDEHAGQLLTAQTPATGPQQLLGDHGHCVDVRCDQMEGDMRVRLPLGDLVVGAGPLPRGQAGVRRGSPARQRDLGEAGHADSCREQRAAGVLIGARPVQVAHLDLQLVAGSGSTPCGPNRRTVRRSRPWGPVGHMLNLDRPRRLSRWRMLPFFYNLVRGVLSPFQTSDFVL